MKCHRDYPAALVWEGEGVPHCPVCDGMIRPDVVLYGENLDQQVMLRAESAIRSADLMIVGGTSLVVYPAAGLLHDFRGKSLVLINRDPTPYDHVATYFFHEDLGNLLDEAVPQKKL
jgi:NAD-dependent deacetylase